MAEDAARKLPNLPLENALQLTLYVERGSPKFEPAACGGSRALPDRRLAAAPALRGDHRELARREPEVGL